MSLWIWLTFALSCVVFSLSPGTAAISTVSHSLNTGFKTASQNIVGLQLGLCVHLLIISMGIGALLMRSELAFSILRYLGAGYLFYLGAQKLFKPPQPHDLNGKPTLSSSRSHLIQQGFWVNLLNPKPIVFLAAFLPQFIRQDAHLFWQYAILSITVVVVDTLVMIGYATLAVVVRRYFQSEAFIALQNKVFGCLFIAIALLMMIYSHGSATSAT